MLGAVILVFVIVVIVLPVAVLMTGAVVAAVLGWTAQGRRRGRATRAASSSTLNYAEPDRSAEAEAQTPQRDWPKR